MADRSSDRVSLLAAALALSLAACAPVPQAASSAPVPLPATAGAGDPLRGAITSAAYAFGDARRLDGRPAEAARAVARLEWMATDLPRDAYWAPAAAVTAGPLRQGRDEVRGSLGIPRDLPASAVAGAMIQAATALDRGDRQAGAAALAPLAASRGDALLARLDHLPPSREAMSATALAYGELIRLGRDTGIDD
jgi:hypothetical protein